MGGVLTQQRDAVDRIEEALTTIVRVANLPRVRTRFATEAGLTVDPGTYPVLRELSAGDGIRLTDLARRCGLESSTASRHVKHLEEAGLVERVHDPDDGRAMSLHLTAEGIRILDAAAVLRRRFVEDLLGSWTPRERASMARLLDRLAGDLVALFED